MFKLKPIQFVARNPGFNSGYDKEGDFLRTEEITLTFHPYDNDEWTIEVYCNANAQPYGSHPKPAYNKVTFNFSIYTDKLGIPLNEKEALKQEWGVIKTNYMEAESIVDKIYNRCIKATIDRFNENRKRI